ncbi:MAG: hypothetical protein AAB250_11555, partial [Bdellovibrionota bacterium]
IPSSPRLQAVDMKEAAPVRPGTPAFGRPEGVSSLKVAAAAALPSFETTAQRSVGIHNEQLTWRDKDHRNAAIAAEMSNRFFMKKSKDAEQPVDVTNGAGAYAGGLPVGLVAVESRPTGFKTDELMAPRNTVRPEVATVFDEEEGETVELQQPEGLYPKGSFLDRTA